MYMYICIMYVITKLVCKLIGCVYCQSLLLANEITCCSIHFANVAVCVYAHQERMMLLYVHMYVHMSGPNDCHKHCLSVATINQQLSDSCSNIM